jgi:hypothetical protein
MRKEKGNDVFNQRMISRRVILRKLIDGGPRLKHYKSRGTYELFNQCSPAPKPVWFP